MTYFFTTNFKFQVGQNQSLLDGQSLKLVLFRFAPSLSNIDPAWVASKTVAELVANAGWVEVQGISGYPLTRTITVSTRVLGGTVRNVTDGVTVNGSANVSSATIAFTAADVGKQISAATIPTGTKIISVLNATTATMDKVATGSASALPMAVGSGSRYVMYTDYKFDGLSTTTEVQAIGVVGVASIGGIANPLIMVTTSPLRGVPNLAPADALTSAPDSTFPDNSNRWLMSWASVTPVPVEGALVIAKGSPPFEVSGSQHVWLYPQRANMISNPSFESASVGVGYWSTNGTLSRVAGGAGGGQYWEGNVVDTTPSYARATGAVGSYIEGPDLPIGGAKKLKFELDMSMDVWGGGALAFVGGQGPDGDYAWRFTIATNTVSTFTARDTASTGQSYLPGNVGYSNASRHTLVGTWLAVDPAAGGQSTNILSVDGGSVSVKTAPAMPNGLYNTSAKTTLGSTAGWGVSAPVNYYGFKLWADDVLVASADFSGMVSGTLVDALGNVWTMKGDAATGGDRVAVALESNMFSTQMGEKFNEHWTVQLMAKGSGRLKVGMVYWNADNVTFSEWGQETWDLIPTAWTHVTCLRPLPNAHLAMVRLELMGGSLTIDKVLAEPGYLKDWPYFDGDEKYGARDDFSWYGGSNRAGKSYSLWYNHRKAVTGRLFARTVDPNDPTKNTTDADVEEMGMVYRWVPAGITVVPHLDCFYPNDAQNPVPTKPAGILPYRTTATPTGIDTPWEFTYAFTGTAGKYVSVSDHASLDITGDLCLMAKVKPENWNLSQTILAKWMVGGQLSYRLQISNGGLAFQWSANGSVANSRASSVGGLTGELWVAATLDVDNGNDGSNVKFWTSPDGVVWTELGTSISTSLTNVFSGTSIVELGSDTIGTNNRFTGLIQDARIYSGIGNNTAPGRGTMVAHWDARIPPTQFANYQDEFGRVWAFTGSKNYVLL